MVARRFQIKRDSFSKKNKVYKSLPVDSLLSAVRSRYLFYRVSFGKTYYCNYFKLKTRDGSSIVFVSLSHGVRKFQCCPFAIVDPGYNVGRGKNYAVDN